MHKQCISEQKGQIWDWRAGNREKKEEHRTHHTTLSHHYTQYFMVYMVHCSFDHFPLREVRLWLFPENEIWVLPSRSPYTAVSQILLRLVAPSISSISSIPWDRVTVMFSHSEHMLTIPKTMIFGTVAESQLFQRLWGCQFLPCITILRTFMEQLFYCQSLPDATMLLL